IGPMARSADDCAIVLHAIAGHDADDTGSLPDVRARFTYAPPAKKLRIGWLTNAWKDIDHDIRQLTDLVFNMLTFAGAHVENATLPDGPWEAAAGVTISVEG